MKWAGDLGAELYVAGNGYGNPQQREDSQHAVSILRELGLEDKIDIFHLKGLVEQRGLFKVTKDPKSEIKLPFLVCVYGCETGSVLGYSGLDQVLEVLHSPMFKANNNPP